MNVTRNISLASLSKFSPRGWLRPAEERKKAREYVEKLRIKVRHLDQEIQTLSGGNQQKVILARWLETQPRVWLLDEPTLGIDVGAKYDIYCLMNEWKARGMAIALITSELAELMAMADRILVLHRGKIVAEFSHDEATQEKIIEAALGGCQENVPGIWEKAI
jgi:ABC-type sugar transport system ATPase subunit